MTGEDLPPAGKGKTVRLWGSQLAYLRHRINSLPAAVRSAKMDGALRQILDDEMRREFGDDYQRRVLDFAEEARRASEPEPARKRKRLSSSPSPRPSRKKRKAK